MIPRQVHDRMLRQLLTPVLPLLDDPGVSEVMINGPDTIWAERAGRLHRVEARFDSSDALYAALRALAQFAGRTIDAERPILEGRLPDGSRVEAIVPPAAPDGPAVAIRRFARTTLTMERLVALGALPSDAAEFLRTLVVGRRNLVVSGGTGSGKTSLLNALAGFVPSGERIVVIEDASELQLQHEHVVRLEAQPADPRGRGAVRIGDLFRATLRMRPDRIVVGEIRGAEAFDLVQAMTSGHGGCLTTIHASHPVDAMRRLESLALAGDAQLPLHAIRAQVASAVDFVAQVSRVRDGSRCVTRISEMIGVEDAAGYEVRDIFEWVGADGDRKGVLRATGARVSRKDIAR